MFEFMKLELRKHRFLFRGIVGAFFGTLAMAALLAVINHRASPLQFAALTTLCWLSGGLWLMPLLYGATSGAALRAEPAASADAGLPLSPGKKMAGALAAMGFYFVCLAAIIGLVAVLLSPYIDGGDISVLSLPKGDDLWHTGLILLAALLAAFIMILHGFTCAYAARQAMFGGLIALLLCGTLAAGMVLGAMTRFYQNLDEPLRSVTPGLILLPLLSVAGMFFALGKLARWGERRVMPGISGWVLIGLGLGVGALSSAGWLIKGYAGLSSQFLLPTTGWRFVNNDPGINFLPGLRQAAARHTLLATRSGGLVSVDGEGKRVQLLPEDPRNPVELMRHPWLTRIRSYAWDVDGSVWVLLQTEMPEDNGQFELWHGSPDAPLKNHAFFKAPAGLHPYRLAHRGETLGIIAATDANNVPDQFAPLPPPAKAPLFAPAGAFMKDQRQRDDFMLEPWIESGELARVSEDGKTLSRNTPGGGTQSWTLPEGATALRVLATVRLRDAGGVKFFLVAVQLPDGGSATAVCRTDGTVRLEWQGYIVPGGGIQSDEGGHLLFNYKMTPYATFVFIVTTDGRYLAPLTVDEKTVTEWLDHPVGPEEQRWIEVLHVKGSRLWLRVGFHSLAEVDGETGKLVKLWNPPKFNTQLISKKGGMSGGRGEVSDAGFHYIAAGRIYHAGFDGVTKDLGPARLD